MAQYTVQTTQTVQKRHYGHQSEIKRCEEGIGAQFYNHASDMGLNLTSQMDDLISSASSQLWEVWSQTSQPAGQDWISWRPISRIGSWPWKDIGGWTWGKKSGGEGQLGSEPNKHFSVHQLGPLGRVGRVVAMCVSVLPVPFSCGIFWGLFCPHFRKSDIQKKIEIQNPWGKGLEKSGLRIKHFRCEVV